MAADYTLTIDSLALPLGDSVGISTLSSVSLLGADPVFSVNPEMLILQSAGGGEGGGGSGPSRPTSGLVYPVYL